jgi:hypothetical protein
LPYDNISKDQFSYIEYNFSHSTPIFTGHGSIDVNEMYETLGQIKNTLEQILIELNIEYDETDINTIGKIV